MLRYLTRLILLLALTFFASGEASALTHLRAPQNDLAGQKLAPGIFSETIAILRHAAASQAAKLQQEKLSAVPEVASASPLAAERLLKMPGELYDLGKFLLSDQGRAMIKAPLRDPCLMQKLVEKLGEEIGKFFSKFKDPEELARMLGGASFDALLAALGGGLAKKLMQFCRETGILCRAAAKMTGALENIGVDIRRATQSLCFVAGTLVLMGDGAQAAIETVEVGQRVATPAQASDETEVDPATWRRIALEVEKDGGATVAVVTLRPATWLEQRRDKDDTGRLWLDIDAIGLHDWARIVSVEACPEIAVGKGRVVLSTITQTAPALMEIRFIGSEERLRPTPSHRLYSATRGNWVRADRLVPGEALETNNGIADVESVAQVDRPERVYNLEVEFDHCYFSGHEQILSHNACPIGAAESGIHKNSLEFIGDTHVYRIKGPDGTTFKIGESARGVRAGDGLSIRAEEQVRRLIRGNGSGFESEIRKTFGSKAAARDYERRLIERFRRMYGDDALSGNKSYH